MQLLSRFFIDLFIPILLFVLLLVYFTLRWMLLCLSVGKAASGVFSRPSFSEIFSFISLPLSLSQSLCFGLSISLFIFFCLQIQFGRNTYVSSALLTFNERFRLCGCLGRWWAWSTHWCGWFKVNAGQVYCGRHSCIQARCISTGSRLL